MKEEHPTGLAAGLASCHTCGRVDSAEVHRCRRCGSALHLRKKDSIQRCVSLLIAALIVYVPATLMPIMTVSQLGAKESKTILQGVAVFWNDGVYSVAIIIFVASVLIPGLKVVALGLLCLVAGGHISLSGFAANRIYFLTELVGRWSMLDVFVVAILVGLVQLGWVLVVNPGSGALAFGAMVILTMLAAHAFEPKLIWDRIRAEERK